MGMHATTSLHVLLPVLLLGLVLHNGCVGADGDTSTSTATVAVAATGALSLQVDGRELPKGLLHARETLAVVAGDLALVFPKWIPGAHAPAGRIDNLVGVHFSSTSKAIGWDRDEADPYRFIVHIPAGVTTLDIELTYIANQADSNSIGVDVAGNDHLALICWNCCVLYPDGRTAASIPVDVQLTTCPNWQVACQLTQTERHKDTIHFARTSLRDLVDQPLIAGTRIVDIPVDGGGNPAVQVSIGSANQTEVLDPRWVEKLGLASRQACLLFGRAHYRSYRWLFVSGDGMEGVGLEHANCSLCGLSDDVMAAYDKAGYDDRNLPVHEYVHSWCGKHVRPAPMATTDFQTTQRLGLLWVYEGLTQYLGEVLGARATLATAKEFRDQLAFNLHDLAHQRGRDWRSVEDTARSSFLLRDMSRHYHELRRDQDYYIEGMLFWLEADLVIRSESHGKSSLDDFARAFLGQPVEPGALRTYAREDVIAALEQVQHHDWKALIEARISSLRPVMETTCLDGSGWKLVYGPELNGGAGDDDEALLDARQSFGCQFHDGRVSGLVPGSPAEAAGLKDGSMVRKINGVEFNGKNLEAALRKAHENGSGEVTLTLWNGSAESTCAATCLVGPLHPHLERITGPDLLSDILRPR